MNPNSFSSRIVTVSSSSSCNNNTSAIARTSNNGGSISSNRSTDLNQDQIFAPNAWWRSFGSSAQQQEQYDNLISMPSSGNVIQEVSGDSCSAIDWESFFAPSSCHHEPKVTAIPTSREQVSCKITINPNCTDNSFNNYSTTTTNTTNTTNNASSLDGMITMLNRILIMNGVNPESNQCQMPSVSYQHSNLETIPSTYVNQTAHFTYNPIQSIAEVHHQNYNTLPSQSQLNTSLSSSSDSDSTGSQHSSNSIGKDRCKISKKRTTRPRLKFQKETDKSIKFNLVTSEELAASLQFHETSAPTSGKRNRGRPKKSDSSPQKPKADQSTTIEFMVNCYDQCSKIFK